MTTVDILKARAADLTTDVLMDAALILDAKPELTSDERLVLAAMLDVIESRLPGASEKLDAWIEDDEDERSYAQVLRDLAGVQYLP